MDNITVEIWKYIAVTAIGILIGGAPSHFLQIGKRPTRTEVETMLKAKIKVESDLIRNQVKTMISTEIKEMTAVQHAMQLKHVEMASTMEGILKELKSMSKEATEKVMEGILSEIKRIRKADV